MIDHIDYFANFNSNGWPMDWMADILMNDESVIIIYANQSFNDNQSQRLLRLEPQRSISVGLHRSNNPQLGILLILHFKYYVPIMTSQNSFSIYSMLYPLTVVNIMKGISLYLLKKFSGKKGNPKQNRQIGFIKLISATVVKMSVYLGIIILLSVIKYISFSLTILSFVIFVISLHFGPVDNRIINVLWRGKPYSSNKIKNAIIYILVLLSIGLQPLEFKFIFELHFQIFIIFTTSMLIFAYYYLHKLAVTVIEKGSTTNMLFQQCIIQLICLICLIIFNVVMEQEGRGFVEQLSYAISNYNLTILLFIINLIYQIALLEMVKKISFNRLIISQVTGLLWFNIYQMVKLEVVLGHYISVIVMMFVLMVNMDLFSEENINKVLGLLAIGKQKKRKRSFAESSQRNGVLN